MSNGGSLILSEELGRQCFLGYEDASAEELREMVNLFRQRAVQATAQQQKVLEKLSSTTESVSLAQQCLQQLHASEISAAERADSLEEELQSSHRQLREREDKQRQDLEAQIAKLESARLELQCTEQRYTQTESRLATTEALAEERHLDAERLSAQLACARQTVASELECAELAEAHQLAARRAREELAVAQTELEVERKSKLEDVAAKRGLVDRSGFYERYFERRGCLDLRQSAHSAVSSDLAPSELEFALSSVEWSTAFDRSCEYRPKTSEVFNSSCDWTLGLNASLECCNKENAIHENSLEYSRISEKSPGSTVGKSADAQIQSHKPKPCPVLCVTQDPVAVPLPSQTSQADAFKPPLRTPAAEISKGNQFNATTTDDDVTIMGMDDDNCIAVGDTKQNQSELLSRERGTKGAGIRYLLDRKTSQGFRETSQLDCVDEDCVAPSDGCNIQHIIHDDQNPIGAMTVSTQEMSVQSALRASWSAGATCAALGEPSLVLIDRLFDQCLERAGGHLQGAASVRRVLADIAGADEELPPQLDSALCHLGSSLDAEVSRAQFRAIVSSALELRQSQEVSRYESTGSVEVASPCHDDICSDSTHEHVTPSLRQSARLVRLWASLPSWSMELGRTSCEAADMQHTSDESIVTASEHWGAVECGFEKLRGAVESLQQHGCDKFLPDGTTFSGIVEDIQGTLGSFVRCFADESRARLQAAHASTGRLLEQKRLAADDMTAQLEARDISLQQARDECASLSSRLRAAEERSACAERLAADASASLAKSQEALQKVEASRVQMTANPTDDLTASVVTIPCWQESPQKGPGLEELLSSLRTELHESEQKRDAAEVAWRDADKRLQALERKYEDDIRSLQTNAAHLSSRLGLSSSSQLPLLRSGELKGSHPDDLLEELKGAATNSAYENALRVEETLRSELQEAREELERHWEDDRHRQTQQNSVAAKDVAAIEFRLGQMHAGAYFEKVSFKRGLRQTRYARLTFDCRRIEWSQNERGPFKVMPVQAILRVDFGDASRAFRCFEFGHRSRPSAGRCLSICTPSRSLDLIAPSEREVEVWVLGLNEIIPYRLERQRFTEEEFLLRRALLRLEDGSTSQELDCQSNATSSIGGTIYTADGSENGSRTNSSLRSAMSSRLGLKLRRL